MGLAFLVPVENFSCELVQQIVKPKNVCFRMESPPIISSVLPHQSERQKNSSA